ncbi:MAG: hypothetical protein V2A74_04430 [bacterium]
MMVASHILKSLLRAAFAALLLLGGDVRAAVGDSDEASSPPADLQRALEDANEQLGRAVRKEGILRERVRLLENQVAGLRSELTEQKNWRTIRELEEEVAEIRGLDLLSHVRFETLSKEKLRGILDHAFDEQYPGRALEGYAVLLHALGLIPEGMNLRSFVVSLYTEQVAGLYDEESGKLYVMDQFDLGKFLSRTILAHEICHALQDQHYHLSDWPIKISGDDDRALAASAVAEGDAMVVMMEFMTANLTPAFLLELPSYLAMDQQSFQGSPEFFQHLLIFPYIEGMNFLTGLEATGGGVAREWPFRRIPSSTEQILHPDKYLEPSDEPSEVTLPDLQADLGEGWTKLQDNVMGELAIRLFLAQHLGGDKGVAAGEGWGGDRYGVYASQDGGKWIVVWYSVWDTTKDAQEFADGFEEFAKLKHADGDFTQDSDEGGWSCRAEDWSAFLWRSGKLVSIEMTNRRAEKRISP